MTVNGKPMVLCCMFFIATRRQHAQATREHVITRGHVIQAVVLKVGNGGRYHLASIPRDKGVP